MTWQIVGRDELLERSAADPFVGTATAAGSLGLISRLGWVASDVGPDGRMAAYAAVDQPLSPSEADELVTVVEALAFQQDARLTWFNSHEGLDLRLGDDWSGETHWVWMTTRTLAPRRDDWQLVELDDQADAEELRAFALPINPIWEGEPGQGRNRFWLAARDERGRLIGCGTVHETVAGIGHLAGIVVDPAVRGGGLGLAITLGLSERVLASDGITTLSAYADNATAIGVYRRAGYRLDHQFHNRWREPRRAS